MLAAVAVSAARNGDYVLAARIFGFVSLWGAQIAPYLRPADWFDMRLDKIPPDIEVEIAAIGLRSLLWLSPDQIIFSNTTGALDARSLAIAAASVIIHAPEKGVAVDPTTLTEARSALGQS